MKQYHELLRTILEKGSYKEPARENMPGTKSLFGYQNRYNLSEGFPILTTKQVSFKNIVTELLWFLRGDTNIKYLLDNDCNIWNEDAYNYYVKLIKVEYPDKPHLIHTFKYFLFYTVNEISCNQLSEYKYGDCGFQYGKVWKEWEGPMKFGDGKKTVFMINQIEKVIDNILTKPYDRRKLVTAIDPGHDEELSLYWCHAMFQFNCRKLHRHERLQYLSIRLPEAVDLEYSILDNNKEIDDYLNSKNIPKYYLDCQLYQRSADVFLGVPYNISSYSLLTHIIAKICNMVPGEFIHSFGDVHIYDNHRDQVDEILTRDPEKYKLPQLKFIDNSIWTEYSTSEGIDKYLFFHSIHNTDFSLENYQHYPAIKAQLSTGMKQDRP